MNGERVLASLLRHRDLWLAALLDRPGHCQAEGLLESDLIKLRDLPDDFWNADTLFGLTATREQARELGRIAEDDGWVGDVNVYETRQEIDRALGISGIKKHGLLKVWWD